MSLPIEYEKEMYSRIEDLRSQMEKCYEDLEAERNRAARYLKDFSKLFGDREGVLSEETLEDMRMFGNSKLADTLGPPRQIDYHPKEDIIDD